MEESIEDNVLEGGEQAVVIQADAADNLEIGTQAIMIQMVANDNEVEEVYSQELDFTNQPLEQNQQQTELDELRKEISKQSNISTTFRESMSERIEKMNKAIADQAEISRTIAEQQKRMIEYQQYMIDSERLLKEKLEAIELEAGKQHKFNQASAATKRSQTSVPTVSVSVTRVSGTGVSNAEARVKQDDGVVQSQGSVEVKPKPNSAVEEQQYIAACITRSKVNDDEKVMMQETLSVAITPIKEAVVCAHEVVVSTSKAIGELSVVTKTLVGCVGVPDGGGSEPGDNPRRPKSVPDKDKGKPTSRKKGKHKVVQLVRHWRYAHGVAMCCCYSWYGRPDQLGLEYVLGECPFLVASLYLMKVTGTWGVRGLVRRIFDPGGIRYSQIVVLWL